MNIELINELTLKIKMNKYSSYDIEKKYLNLPIDELKNIVYKNSKEYRPSVINIIIKIIENRGETVDTSNIEYGNESTIKHDLVHSENKSITLLLIGIIFLIISLGLSIAVLALNHQELSILNIISKLIISIVSMKMAYDYAKRLNRKKYIWGFLGLIFGGLSLIILSFFKKEITLSEVEKITFKKKNKKIFLISFVIIFISIIGFIGINNFLDKKRESDFYQEYIDNRIDYIKNPKIGDIFFFAGNNYGNNIKAKVIKSNKDSILFKSPKNLGKDFKELYKVNGYDMSDDHYLFVWVTKDKLRLAVESDISDSGNFEGIPFEELSNSEIKYRFDRLEN